jgi:hypothetical protein
MKKTKQAKTLIYLKLLEINLRMNLSKLGWEFCATCRIADITLVNTLENSPNCSVNAYINFNSSSSMCMKHK